MLAFLAGVEVRVTIVKSLEVPLMLLIRRGEQQGRGFLAAGPFLIPVLYCPLPNGDNDTLINTNTSIPIIGK